MKDKNGHITKVETPQEFLEKFSHNSWEYDYISEEEMNLIDSWLEEYIKLKQFPGAITY